MKSELWTTLDQLRYFIINEAENLPTGDLIIRTVSGREIGVTAESLTPYEVDKAAANEFVAGQIRSILNEIKQKLRQAQDEAAAEQPVDPQEALFQADLMEGAARAVGRLAEVLGERLQKEADSLRKKATDTPTAVQPEADAIAANKLNFSNDAMPVISHRLNGNGRHQPDKGPSANQSPADQ